MKKASPAEVAKAQQQLSYMGQYTGNKGDILVRIRYPAQEIRNGVSAAYKIEREVEKKGRQVNKDNVKAELQSISQEELGSIFIEIKKWGFRNTVFTAAIWDLRSEYREEILTGLVERGSKEALAKFVNLNRDQLSDEQRARLEKRVSYAA